MDSLPDSSSPAKPARPTRLDRLFGCVSPFYFVTFNTYRRAPLLAREEIHVAFVAFCRRAERFSVSVGRYVVMPDHVHLLVAMPEIGGPTLSHWIKSLKAVLGQTLLALGATRPHWQEGFFDHVLRNEESHAQKWDYVRFNPVRAGLCPHPEDWPFQGEIIVL